MEPFWNHLRGRRAKLIHSIPYSVALPLERSFINYASMDIKGYQKHSWNGKVIIKTQIALGGLFHTLPPLPKREPLVVT